VEGGVDGPVAFWRFTDSEAGEEALVEGPLVIEDGCAFVGLGVETTLMLWAYGTSWDAGTESIVFPNGTTAVAGDIVSAGGGSASINDLDNITSNELVTEALARCAPDGGVFVVQSDVDVNNPFG